MSGKNECRVVLFAEYRPVRSRLLALLTFKKSCSIPFLADVSIQCMPKGMTVRQGDLSLQFILENLDLPVADEQEVRPSVDGQVEVTLPTSFEESLILPGGLETPDSIQETLVRQVQECQAQWTCASCGHLLLHKDKKFSRVLPLPSETWAEKAEFWFCHQHSDSGDLTQQTQASSKYPLNPRPTDCLVGPLYLRLPCTYLRQDAVTIQGEAIRCQHCAELLGAFEGSSGEQEEGRCMQLFTHAICIQNPDKQGNDHQVERCLSRMEVFLHTFLLDQSRDCICFRFLLQPPGANASKSAILVWLLDQNLIVYSASGMLQEEPTSVSVHQKKAIQLLYLTEDCCKEQQNWPSTCAEWLADDGVHLITVPKPLCDQIAVCLTASTSRLPSHRRQASGFQVAILQSDVIIRSC